MQNDSGSTTIIDFTSADSATQPGPAGLSKLEVERTRVFFKASVGGTKEGSVSNAHWTIKYRADGTGTVQVSFTESVKFRILKGQSQVGLIDDQQKVLALWDVAYWRNCGERTISFEQPITAAIGELANGITFRVDGDGRPC